MSTTEKLDFLGVEAVSMLSLRLTVDILSLRVDAGEMTLENAKKLIEFSAREVVRGSPHLENQVNGIKNALLTKFDETNYT